jgi:glycosyltransferase involved in cell wall biosynthesis
VFLRRNRYPYAAIDYLDLAQKTQFLIDNPEVARPTGEKGRRWARDEFTVEKYAGKVLRVLKETPLQNAA